MDQSGRHFSRQPIGLEDWHGQNRRQPSAFEIGQNIPRPLHRQQPDYLLQHQQPQQSAPNPGPIPYSGQVIGPSVSNGGQQLQLAVHPGGLPTPNIQTYNDQQQQQQQQQQQGFTNPVPYFQAGSMTPSVILQSGTTEKTAHAQAEEAYFRDYATQHPFNDNLTFAILAVLFCFWPLGLAAIVASIQARRAYDRGDLAQAYILAGNSKSYSISAVVAIAFFIIVVISVVVTIRRHIY